MPVRAWPLSSTSARPSSPVTRPTPRGYRLGMTSQQPTHREVIEATAASEATMRPQSVPVNVYETTGALVIVAPLPAVTPHDVTVEVGEGRIRFWARLRSAAPREYLVNE